MCLNFFWLSFSLISYRLVKVLVYRPLSGLWTPWTPSGLWSSLHCAIVVSSAYSYVLSSLDSVPAPQWSVAVTVGSCCCHSSEQRPSLQWTVAVTAVSSGCHSSELLLSQQWAMAVLSVLYHSVKYLYQTERLMLWCRLCKYVTWSVGCLRGGLSGKGRTVDN